MKSLPVHFLAIAALCLLAPVATASDTARPELTSVTSLMPLPAESSEYSPNYQPQFDPTYVAMLEQRVSALEAGYHNMANEKEREKADSGPKQIDIQTKPAHKWRGRIFLDGINIDDDDATSAVLGTDRDNVFGFDTARIGVEGLAFENVKYCIEVEFEGTEVDFKDVYIQTHALPILGHIKAGHFKEPIGLEELTSAKYTTFMERSYATSTFAPARNYGVMAFNHLDASEECTWFLGTFRHISDDSPSGYAAEREDKGDWVLSSRLAWLPFYDEPSGGRYLVHVGGSYSYRQTDDDKTDGVAEFAPKAWVGNQAPLGVGARATGDSWHQVGLEFLTIWGASSLQAEYFHAFVDSGEEYNGAYVQASYFLTGEHRGYKKSAKACDRVKPFGPAFLIDTQGGPAFGPGAVELTAGYSFVDLEEGVDVSPGEEVRATVDGFILGVNWYFNPYSRLMFNYNLESADYVNPNIPDADANLFGLRWQVDW